MGLCIIEISKDVCMSQSNITLQVTFGSITLDMQAYSISDITVPYGKSIYSTAVYCIVTSKCSAHGFDTSFTLPNVTCNI